MTLEVWDHWQAEPAKLQAFPSGQIQQPGPLSPHRSSTGSECGGPNPAAVETGSSGPPTLSSAQQPHSLPPQPSPRMRADGLCPHRPTGAPAAPPGNSGASEQRRRQLPANPRPRSLDRRGSVRALARREASGGLPRPGSGPQPALPRPLPPVCDRTSMLSFPLSKVSFKILPLCVAFYAKVV